jgi:hypothetical protein
MPQQWFMEKMISQEWEVILFWNTIVRLFKDLADIDPFFLKTAS